MLCSLAYILFWRRHALEKNLYSAVLVKSVPQMSILLLILCLFVLSISKNVTLKCPTSILELSFSNFSFVNFCFKYFEALLLALYKFAIFIYLLWIDNFHYKSLIISRIYIKSILSDFGVQPLQLSYIYYLKTFSICFLSIYLYLWILVCPLINSWELDVWLTVHTLWLDFYI